jgi:hypothetical protein
VWIEDPDAKFVKNSSILESGSDATFTYANHKMNRCDTAHRCTNPDSILPTRVLDVSGNELILFESAKDQRALYAALSYSWRSSEPIVTTTKNIEDYKLCIPYSKLPRSLKDAVTVCRKF